MPPFLARLATLVGAAGLAAGCSHGSSTDAPSGVVTPVTFVSAAADAPPAPAPSASSADGGAAGFVKANIDYVLNPYNLPAYTGPTGSVEGTVTIDGPPAPSVTLDSSKCAASIDMYGKLFREGAPVRPAGPRPLADAVVVVVGYTDYYVREPSEVVKITIAPPCAYPSRTLAITYGQRIEISNESDLIFAPLIDEVSTPAVMVAPPRGTGEAIKLYPQRAGHFTLTDRLEGFVREDLYVFRHPLHAVTDRSGHFRIDGVPVGRLKLGVAHPGAGAQAEVPIDITAGGVQKADVKVTYKPAAPPPPKPASSEVIPPWKRPNE